jgi:hypothetical protein
VRSLIGAIESKEKRTRCMSGASRGLRFWRHAPTGTEVRGVRHAVPLVSNYLVQTFNDICQLLGRYLADSLANTLCGEGANLAYLDPGSL